MAKLLTIVNYLFLPLSLVLSVITIKFILNEDIVNSTCPYRSQLKSLIPNNFTMEGKIVFILKMLSFTAIVIFVQTLLVVVSRLLTLSPNPQAEKDNSLINTINKAIQNTLEQTFIFFALFSFWFISYASEADAQRALHLVFLFLFARIVFTFGMIFNMITSIILFRAYAMHVNLVLIVYLIARNVQCPCFAGFLKFFN